MACADAGGWFVILQGAGMGIKPTADALNLKRYIRDIPDFPTKGILFRDITPLLQNGPVFRQAIKVLASRHYGALPDAVVAIESRGLIVGSALAYELGVGVVPVRKKGKLPHETYSATYTLEYGQDTLEIHRDALAPGARVLLVDDLLATGGTMEATIALIEQCGGRIVELAFLIELTALQGRARLAPHPIISLIQY
jgi:adenine phosphoribosyltransferase